jgi:hypothetical protein
MDASAKKYDTSYQDRIVLSIQARCRYNPASQFPFKELFMRKSFRAIFLLLSFALLISACGKAPDPAAKAVENYLTALVNKDSSRLSALSCADWESNALLELDSLQAVTTTLDGLACSVTGTDGTTSEVTCQGKILATYNTEQQQLDLSLRIYQVVKQGGEYLVCGYK